MCFKTITWRKRGYNEGFQSLLLEEALFAFGVERTDLVVLINTTMTAQRYRDIVIEPIIAQFAGAIGKNFLLVDDNASPHRARIITESLEFHGVNRIDTIYIHTYNMSWPKCRGN